MPERFGAAGSSVVAADAAQRPLPHSSEVDNKAVRAWAASNGIELSTRGRIPASVLEQYRAAGN